ncbi:hypothetical protein EJ03DRAFT_222142 [Teratosphaeria nubilosa]|uniref:Uncharacterized protein n=1 Tax=Teratosphaeria nubilosa TaxID=161662 RepID=A0A6G1KWE2_9PEZI|nr:hypothetical protein EJ03DRAFT_222142 [Teratosphaeria nubilosa]
MISSWLSVWLRSALLGGQRWTSELYAHFFHQELGFTSGHWRRRKSIEVCGIDTMELSSRGAASLRSINGVRL